MSGTGWHLKKKINSSTVTFKKPPSVRFKNVHGHSLLTLLAAQQPLNTLDELVSVAVGVNPNLLQLLVAHVSQDI